MCAAFFIHTNISDSMMPHPDIVNVAQTEEEQRKERETTKSQPYGGYVVFRSFVFPVVHFIQ